MGNKRNKQVVHELQFNVAQLLKEVTGANRRYDVNSKIIDRLDEDTILISPLVGQVKFLRTGSDILVYGSLQTIIQKSCGRCLISFTTPISMELEEQFYPTVDVTTGSALSPPTDSDEANRINEQHILDLLEVVRQGLLLESGGFLYCRPDCKGLCPQCGQDRNTNSCTCQDDAIDVRWAGLQALQESINSEQ